MDKIVIIQTLLIVIMLGMFCICWLLQDISTYLELIFKYSVKGEVSKKSRKHISVSKGANIADNTSNTSSLSKETPLLKQKKEV